MIEKACSRCGATFGCGRDAPGCWCTELPPLPATALDGNADCLCRRCLAAQVEALAGTRAAITHDIATAAAEDSSDARG